MTDRLTSGPCPYGGSAIIIYQLTDKGIWSKCSLASSVRKQVPNSVRGEWADQQREEAKCPKPIWHGIDYHDHGGRDYRHNNCPYIEGNWIQD